MKKKERYPGYFLLHKIPHGFLIALLNKKLTMTEIAMNVIGTTYGQGTFFKHKNLFLKEDIIIRDKVSRRYLLTKRGKKIATSLKMIEDYFIGLNKF